jgi:hypothetical protein
MTLALLLFGCASEPHLPVMDGGSDGGGHAGEVDAGLTFPTPAGPDGGSSPCNGGGGRGIGGPWAHSSSPLKITPTSYDFGAVTVGQVSAMPAAFSLTNVGAAFLSAPAISVSAPFVVQMNDCDGGLRVGDTCTVFVAFAPKSAGAYGGALAVCTSDVTVSAALTGLGLAPDGAAP